MDIVTMAMAKGKFANSKPILLDNFGIISQSLVVQGGGSEDVNANVIFDNLKVGKNHLFAGYLGENIIAFAPTFYRIDSDGNIDQIGYSISGDLGGTFIRADFVLSRETLICAVTPLS